MALTTDDCDLRDVKFYMTLGGNGDYYLNLLEYPMPESSSGATEFKRIDYRMAMSGGQTSNHSAVRLAFAKLFEEMEKAGLNRHPIDDKIEAKKV